MIASHLLVPPQSPTTPLHRSISHHGQSPPKSRQLDPSARVATDPTSSPETAKRASSAAPPSTRNPRLAHVKPHLHIPVHIPGHNHRHNKEKEKDREPQSAGIVHTQTLPVSAGGAGGGLGNGTQAARLRGGEDPYANSPTTAAMGGTARTELRRMPSTRSYKGGRGGEYGGNGGVGGGRPRARTFEQEELAKAASEDRLALEREEAKRQKALKDAAEEVERLKARGKEGEVELRRAVDEVGEVSTTVTRRLDYTYYNLLEKLGQLSATIQSFHGLSEQTARLVEEFEKESTGVVDEVGRQVDEMEGWGYVRKREERIEGLEERMRNRRERAESLGKRLEIVREKVQGWETREGEWQKSISRRLRMTWTCLALVLASCVVFFVLCCLSGDAPPPHEMLVAATKMDKERDRGKPFVNRSLYIDVEKLKDFRVPRDVEDVLKTVMNGGQGRPSASAPTLGTTATEHAEDPRLRRFDEL